MVAKKRETEFRNIRAGLTPALLHASGPLVHLTRGLTDAQPEAVSAATRGATVPQSVEQRLESRMLFHQETRENDFVATTFIG